MPCDGLLAPIYLASSPRSPSVFTILYGDTSQYLPKTVLYFCKRTVSKVLCYQNMYAEKHGRNLHVHILIGDNHG